RRVRPPRRPARPRRALHPDAGILADPADPARAVSGSATGAGGGAGSWEDEGVPLDPDISRRLRRDGAGLVCAVIQDDETDEVLMVGWMDDEALHRTLTE